MDEDYPKYSLIGEAKIYIKTKQKQLLYEDCNGKLQEFVMSSHDKNLYHLYLSLICSYRA